MKTVSLLLITLSLFSCSKNQGGGVVISSPEPSAPSVVSGVLLDSAVGGVYFRSDSRSGMTDDQGRYECIAGENVEFFLKGDNGKEVTLGASACRGIISPIDLSTNGTLNYQTAFIDLSSNQRLRVVGILRLLQSMDADENPSNGITIVAADVSILANELEQNYTLNVALESLFTDSQGYETSLDNLITLMGKHLVSEASAIAHFNDSRQQGGGEPCEGEGCNEPYDPPSDTECYQGVTYGSSVYGQGGITYGSNYPIDVNTGELKVDAGFNEKIYTLIVIPPTGNADIYRLRNSIGGFYKFSMVMTVREESGLVHLRGVNFTDGMQTLTLGAKIDSGGIMTRTGTELTFGSFSSAFDRTFNKVDCYPPVNYIDVGNIE